MQPNNSETLVSPSPAASSLAAHPRTARRPIGFACMSEALRDIDVLAFGRFGA